MDKSVRAVLILLVLIVVPFLIYAFIQVKSLEEDEQMASAIYKKQMETVLFSLNQYSDDMMDQWIRKLSTDQNPIAINASNLVLGNESIQLLVLRKMETYEDTIFQNDYVQLDENTVHEIQAWYTKKDSVLSQLTTYLSAGFQKIQPANDWISISGLKFAQAGITVMTYDKDSILYNALFVFEPNYWVEQLIGPKMQEIAQSEIKIAALFWPNSQEAPSVMYSTEPFNLEKEYIKKGIWILPDIYLAIQSKGESFAELIRKRSQNNLYILFFSVLTLLIGAFVMIRNIRNALKVAQLKSDFVSNVSHEIRTPLALIRMYAETLKLGRLPSDEKKQQYYEVIHHESGRLAYLVNNILDFSRIEANRKTYNLVDLDMNNLVQELYANYSYSFKEKEVESILRLANDPINIKVDTQAFEEALSNLIENAIKYSDKDKSISITTSSDANFAYCKVTDKGIGIPKHNQQKIFDKFYRVEDALTQKTKGTGLGLNIVKHIMKSHQGSVSVSSKPNEGSTFTLKLPLVKKQK